MKTLKFERELDPLPKEDLISILKDMSMLFPYYFHIFDVKGKDFVQYEVIFDQCHPSAGFADNSGFIGYVFQGAFYDSVPATEETD